MFPPCGRVEPMDGGGKAVKRELLSEDGVIFVSIDDNEQHHLRMLMDEIFGEDNFLACISWEKRYRNL